MVSCDERDRLAQARQSAQRDQFELEEKLGHLLVSPKEIERARRRSAHVRQQLMDISPNTVPGGWCNRDLDEAAGAADATACSGSAVCAGELAIGA